MILVYEKLIMVVALLIGINLISKGALSELVKDGIDFIRRKVVTQNIIELEQLKKEHKAFKEIKGFRAWRNDFLQDIITDLEYTAVTPQGMWIGILMINSLLSIGIYFYTRNILIGIISYPILIVQILSIFYLLSRMSHEHRILSVMDAMDMICPLIETNGITRSIEISLEYFDPMIQKYFETFLMHIREQNYYFGEAMELLRRDLGDVFNDFAKRAVIYNDNPSEGSADIFLDIIDNNADMRMIIELKKRDFETINFEFIVSFLVIAMFVIIMMVMKEGFRDFYLTTYVGRTLLIMSLSFVSIIFSILQYLQSTLDNRKRILRDRNYLE